MCNRQVFIFETPTNCSEHFFIHLYDENGASQNHESFIDRDDNEYLQIFIILIHSQSFKHVQKY